MTPRGDRFIHLMAAKQRSSDGHTPLLYYKIAWSPSNQARDGEKRRNTICATFPACLDFITLIAIGKVYKL